MSTPPDNPAGPPPPTPSYSDDSRDALIDAIRSAPARLQAAVAGLSDVQLDQRYKNWTIRQIVHHLADSHAHIYIRFKWTLTEATPTIKAYEEADWVELTDSKLGDTAPALALLEALHAKWTQLMETMGEADFAREFHHPQSGKNVSLWTTLNYYPWHAKHHTAQVQWLRDQHGW
ncbi:YfiT family bacillithiol transferase [Botrimarina mediterranea]|uniref:Metal-dependent hydrolase YfiT n=1 Tax=Botrimarina mediterranea TaxID=2528022 RepID=A0A518K9J0_9BACT|nr:putative metal-dependent hydrolase [Botrimarina mediterranea]QDV74456.1 Putative metal-dependent hydrolase YfiT [Botrimarina mediterranea]QDV79052.1 Putative metal-dependent hydrolase YfiT [Planctomycetes bacterium K2D]